MYKKSWDHAMSNWWFTKTLGNYIYVISVATNISRRDYQVFAIFSKPCTHIWKGNDLPGVGVCHLGDYPVFFKFKKVFWLATSWQPLQEIGHFSRAGMIETTNVGIYYLDCNFHSCSFNDPYFRCWCTCESITSRWIISPGSVSPSFGLAPLLYTVLRISKSMKLCVMGRPECLRMERVRRWEGSKGWGWLSNTDAPWWWTIDRKLRKKRDVNLRRHELGFHGSTN